MNKNYLMILAGLLLIAFGAANTFGQARQADSPFDVIEHSPADLEPDRGFIPMVVPVEEDPVTEQISGAVQILPSNASQVFEPDGGDTHRQADSQRVFGLTPERLVIPSIDLDAPIKLAKLREIEYLGANYYQWIAPYEFAVGWHNTSAKLGVTGNTVLNGHHNAFEEVFGNLVDVNVGDIIQIYSGDRVFAYQVTDKLIIPERWQKVETRIENAKWIATTADERITLVTCWPKESNTHRLIVIALPVNK